MENVSTFRTLSKKELLYPPLWDLSDVFQTVRTLCDLKIKNFSSCLIQNAIIMQHWPLNSNYKCDVKVVIEQNLCPRIFLKEREIFKKCIPAKITQLAELKKLIKYMKRMIMQAESNSKQIRINNKKKSLESVTDLCQRVEQSSGDFMLNGIFKQNTENCFRYQNSNEKSSLLCKVCCVETNAKNRCCCFICQKVFHKWCRDNWELIKPSQWICAGCKDREKSARNLSKPITNVKGESVIKQEVDSNGNSNASYSWKNDVNFVGPMEWSAVDMNYSFVDNEFNITGKGVKMAANKLNSVSSGKTCTAVPRDHSGPVPGIPVGTTWEHRLLLSVSGVHRPLVGGIHGRGNEGAFSIILSGAYEDDQDNGDEFFYSGCGGRKKCVRSNLTVQVADQELTRYNKALALCCNAPLNDQFGAEAQEWRAGKPVRVVRNHKLGKYSIYAPGKGNRYDGIYKVVKYFPVIGKSGLLIWKYFFRRDDPEPAPWTEEGQRLNEDAKSRIKHPDTLENADSRTVHRISKNIANFTEQKNEDVVLPLKKRRYDDIDGHHVNSNDESRLMDRKFLPNLDERADNIFESTQTLDSFDEIDIKPDLQMLQASLMPPICPFVVLLDHCYSRSFYNGDKNVQSKSALNITISSVNSLNLNSDYFSTLHAENNLKFADEGGVTMVAEYLNFSYPENETMTENTEKTQTPKEYDSIYINGRVQ